MVLAPVQAGADSSSEQDGRDGGKERWFASGYIPKVEPRKFCKGLDGVCGHCGHRNQG